MSRIKVLYFGMFEEKAGTSSEAFEIEQETIPVSGFEEYLLKKHPEFNGLSYSIAVNQQINTNKEMQLSENDEIAILPPFAGG